MERQSLEDVALRWMRFWQGAELDTFESVHASDFVDHSAAGRAGDRNSFRQGIIELRRGFPDFNAAIELLAIDEEKSLVTIRWSALGRFQDSFLGASPTAKPVTFTGIEIIRVQGGQVIERWGEWDEAAIRAQLGGI